jgi:dihydrodipicolinate synthase/N-acetylneuraminate lyase
MKDITECHTRLRGLFNITVTPFKADGAFDHAGLASDIERVIGLGFDGILIGGTYGEFPAMSTEERVGLFRRVMDIVGDRVPVMLCTAGSDVRVVHELTTLARNLGGPPMVTPTYVSEITDSQIVAFFRDMVPLRRTSILVYNAPRELRLCPITSCCSVLGMACFWRTAISDYINRWSDRMRDCGRGSRCSAVRDVR